MHIEQTPFPDLYIFTPRVFTDSRGFFMESYSQHLLTEYGLDYTFIQDNHARSEQAGVLRGLHFQLPPAAQTKLVRVTRGAVFDVVVDLRTNSPCFGKAYSITLSAKNHRQLLIPRGFAHAYKTLEPETEFQYKVDAPYAPEHDSGIRWNDTSLNIAWPGPEPILSAKDTQLPLLKDMNSPFRLP